MSKWSESRIVTRKSWAVIKENRYLLGFPLVGFVLSIVPLLVFWAPAAYFFSVDSNIIGIVLIVLGFFGITTVATLATAGLVAAADEELAGRSSSLGHGLSRAFGRFGTLLRWSIISTIVGLLIGLVRGNGQGGIVAVILRNIIAAAASVMWDVITFFALPVIMFENAGPIDSIKRSAALVKRKWGTQILGGVRIGGLIGLVAILPSILLIVVGAVVAINGLVGIGIPLLILGFLVFAAAMLVASAMRGIFSVALYRFATDGQVASTFTEAELQMAVRTK